MNELLLKVTRFCFIDREHIKLEPNTNPMSIYYSMTLAYDTNTMDNIRIIYQ